MQLVGFLSPDGKFTECKPCNHRFCAETICEREGISKEEYKLFGAEQYIMEMGYICFRASNIFMNSQKHSKNFTECNFLTKEQEVFLTDLQKRGCVTLAKYDDIQYIIDLQETLKERYNSRGVLYEIAGV